MSRKIKIHMPWKPTCWVGDRRPVEMSEMDPEDQGKYLAAMYANAAILRARRR